MIDKMIRCKNLEKNDKIESLAEWFQKCPPQGKELHWVDGRSAKETAKHWAYTIPQPFKDILSHHKLKYNLCSAEYVTNFDQNGGNGRNHDLLILANDTIGNPVVISIESKVDESFGDTIAQTVAASTIRFQENENSKGLKRIQELRVALFGSENTNQNPLRYQFFTAIAGTIAEAKKQGAKTAFFLIQTFESSEIDKKKHAQNQSDLDEFIKLYSNSKYLSVPPDRLIGPFRVANPTQNLLNDIDLWIGKYRIEI